MTGSQTPDTATLLTGIAAYEHLDMLAREKGAQLTQDWPSWSARTVARDFETLAARHGRAAMLAAYGLLVRRERRRTDYRDMPLFGEEGE